MQTKPFRSKFLVFTQIAVSPKEQGVMIKNFEDGPFCQKFVMHHLMYLQCCIEQCHVQRSI